jgi:hypothetical protein
MQAFVVIGCSPLTEADSGASVDQLWFSAFAQGIPNRSHEIHELKWLANETTD